MGIVMPGNFKLVHIKQVFRVCINEVPHFTSLSEGVEVSVTIDGERRMLNARVHSAGHLLDSALYQLGMTDLEPSKVCYYSLYCKHRI